MRTLIEKQYPDEILPYHRLNKANLNNVQKLINDENSNGMKILINILQDIHINLGKLPDDCIRMAYIMRTYLYDHKNIKQLVIDEARDYWNGIDDEVKIEFEYKCFLVNADVLVHSKKVANETYLTPGETEENYTITEFELTILND